MKALIYLIIFSLLAVAGQLTFVSRLDQSGIFLDLPLALVLACALSGREPKHCWLILLPVFLFDLLAGRFFGILTLSAWLIFLLLRWLTNFLFKKNESSSLFILGAAGFGFFYLAVFVFEKIATNFFELAGRQIFWPFAPGEFMVALALNSFLIWALLKSGERLNLFKD
ncbi:MAG: hypothetical protein PHW33_03400 [Candidatus Portnoybacteria bacterium]|nr:hypothetical protein [Candidatus Portnoybacteria bacterium]